MKLSKELFVYKQHTYYPMIVASKPNKLITYGFYFTSIEYNNHCSLTSGSFDVH